VCLCVSVSLCVSLSHCMCLCVCVCLRHDRYPVHTGLSDRQDQVGGDIVAPKGTSVSLEIESSLPLYEAWITYNDSIKVPIRSNNRTAQAEISVTRDHRYTIGLLDSNMVSNRDPVEYRIIALPDHNPEVRLLRPGPVAELGETQNAFLIVEAYDDYGLSRMEVVYNLEGEDNENSLQIPIDKPGAEISQSHLWNLSQMGLLPGDRVSYNIRVYDNNPVPSMGETDLFLLRFPSLFEIHQEARRAQEESLDQMERLYEGGDELQERLERVARELLKKDDMDWQDQKELESALEDHRQTANKLEETAEKLDDALDRLEQSGILENETLSKLEEIQSLLSEIRTPELKEALEKLQEAMKNLNPEDVQEALESFRLEHDEFQLELDRTISLLRRIQQEQALDALAKQLEKLAEEQEEIADRLERDAPNNDMAEREELLEENARQLEQDLEQAAEKLPEPTAENLSKLSQEMRDREIANRMNRASQEMRADRHQPSKNQSRDLADDLRQLSQKLQNMREEFLQTQRTELARELNRALQDLLSLSRAQEETAQKAASASRESDTSPLSREQARNIAGANRMADRLLKNSHKSLFVPPQVGAAMGQALQKMDETAGHLQNGNSPRASQSAKEAMGNLNASALMIRDALAALSAASSATGFEEMLQRMEELSEQQGDLNAQTQGMSGQPQRPGGKTQMGFGQMAARQRAIQEALEALRREMAAQRQQLMGDLGNIASDMEKTASELARSQVTPQTLNRQRQILSRMLDAQHSIRQRGKSKDREARQGKTYTYRGPGTLPAELGETDNPLRLRLQEALDQGYPPEYQALIRHYFESLIQDAISGETNE